MGRLALVVGSSLRGAELPDGDWQVLQRHGEATAYVLPHRIDHVANMSALAGAGCDRVLAVGSVGGLRQELAPGTMMAPDDFIALDAEPRTALEGAAAHRAAGFDDEWRSRLLATLAEAGNEVRDGGVYWQANGPRFETPAEVRLIAQNADVVGMTIGSECVAASELDLAYAALCMVDNLANGLADVEISTEQVDRNRAANRARLQETLAAMLPALAG